MDKLFVYGTLQVPELFFAVTGIPYPATHRARLHGYQCYRVKDACFPAVVPEADCTVDGMLLEGLSEPTLILLDDYEDVDYQRLISDVETESGQQSAYFYCFKEHSRHRLSGAIWKLEKYRDQILSKLDSI